MNIKQLCDPMKIINIDDDRSESSPIFVEIHPTNKCNLECIYCSYKQRKINQSSIDGKNLIRLCKDLTLMNVKAVCFSGGGEPTLHPNIVEAIKLLYDNQIPISLLTNGTNIDTLKSVVKMCTYILVHISSNDIYESKRIMGKNAKGILKEISGLKEISPLTTIGARLVINEMNWRNYNKTIQKAINSGLDYIQCCPAINYEENYAYLSEEQCSIIKSDPIFNNDNVMWLEKSNDYTYMTKKCLCIENKIHVTVKANGDLCICPSHFGETDVSVIGNINKNRICDIWNSQKHNLTIDLIQKDKMKNCAKCRFNNYNSILNRIDKAKENAHRYFL